MAGQFCNCLGADSKIYAEKSRHINVIFYALFSRSRPSGPFPCPSVLVTNSDYPAYDPCLRPCYSVLLLIVTPYLTRNLFASLGGLRITREGLTVSLLGHVIYGIFLGLLISTLV